MTLPMDNTHFVFSELSYRVGPNELPMACVSILFYYFYKEKINFFYKGIINPLFLRKELKNLILNYKFFSVKSI